MIKKTLSFTFRTLVISFVFVCVFILALWLYVTSQEKELQGKFYPNVYVNNIYFGRKNEHDLIQYFAKKNDELAQIQIITRYKDSDVATFSGKMLNAHFDATTALIQAASIGRSDRITTKIAEQMASLFKMKRFDFEANFSYEKKPFEDYLDSLSDRYNTEPQNALFRVENNRVTAFKVEKNGLHIDKDKALAEFEKKLAGKIAADSVIPITISAIDTLPEVTLSNTNNFGIVEKIAEGQSNYSGSIPGRIHNVLLAASKFDGVMIPKGDTFSFNKVIGDVSSSTGYEQAYIIKQGQTVLGDGGGVCQVSTTLFRSALHAGLPIVERHAHAYQVHYYTNDSKPGFDATVFAPSVDFKFTNDTPASILIQEEVDKKKNMLKFTFYGKRDDRKVEISDVKLANYKPAPDPTYQDDPTLKRGTTKQIDWAATGITSKFHYRVVNNNQMTVDRDFISIFKPWRAVYLVGTAD